MPALSQGQSLGSISNRLNAYWESGKPDRTRRAQIIAWIVEPGLMNLQRSTYFGPGPPFDRMLTEEIKGERETVSPVSCWPIPMLACALILWISPEKALEILARY
jgi:hypothetical protein